MEWIFTVGTMNYYEESSYCKIQNARLPKYDEITSSYEFSMENPNRISRVGHYWTDSYFDEFTGRLEIFVQMENRSYKSFSYKNYYYAVCVKDVMKRTD